MKKLCLFLIIFFSFILNVNAESRTGFLANTKAFINNDKTTKITDNNYNTYITIAKGKTLKINNDTKFNNIYIVYYLNSQTGTLKIGNKEQKIGENNFLHEYIKLKSETNEITIDYDNDVKIKEIFVFSGEVPSWVQIWEKPHEDADIMLISTHSDDEQLFFAGLIPYMVANNKKMQVVYFANHNDTPSRLDEQLNGLWAVGLRNYPVLGYIPDAYSTSLNGAISNLKGAKLTTDDTIKYIVNMIRRFKPEVVVDHDEKGEYGHGQHILNTYSLEEALKVVNSKEYVTEYEPFEPSKVYLHLYKEHQIKMDYDTPLDYFNGKTAFQMSQLGYKEHLSQQYTWFTRWINGNNNEITKATQITKYNPTEFGLYYSTVGYEDKNNDMFSNIIDKKKLVADGLKKDIKEVKKEEPKKEEKTEFKINIPIIITVSIIILIILFAIAKINSSSRQRRRWRRIKRMRRRKHRRR